MAESITPAVSIVIVNYKTKGLLRQFLLSVRTYPPLVSHEIIVVDNNSDDGSVEMLAKDFPEISLIPLKKNFGYSRGTNEGVKMAKAPLVLLMNTDLVFEGHVVDALVRYMTENPKVGAVAPRLNNADGTLQYSAYRFYNFLTPFYRRSFLAHTDVGKKEIDRFLMLDWDHLSSRPVDWLMSSCLLVRKQSYDEIHGFDERFFVYLSDTDFCRRLWLAKWSVHYVADVSMIHYHRRESAERLNVSLIHTTDFIRYFWKWFRQTPPNDISGG